ncbi:MAG: C-GCAxxG-C-C family (seleno)protein [Bacteroidales bacterium]|jgi:hypothetical protein
MKKVTKSMSRRDFVRISATGAIAASMLNSTVLMAATKRPEDKEGMTPKDIRKDFFTYACSGALFLHLNRYYGYPKEDQAFAVAALSGGILQEGYQCGMLWGSTLAVGAESFREYGNGNQAICSVITTTQHLMRSFSARAKCIYCRDITGVEWSKKLSIPKYMITGKMFKCLNIGKKWAPEAIQAASEGFSDTSTQVPEQVVSCASEVARKMGASEEEAIMVSGLAGGMGLSGHACGALATAVWIKSLAWYKENPDPDTKEMYNPHTKATLDAFYKETGSEMLCSKICGKHFSSVKEHTEFIQNGGCSKLIELLSKV